MKNSKELILFVRTWLEHGHLGYQTLEDEAIILTCITGQHTAQWHYSASQNQGLILGIHIKWYTSITHTEIIHSLCIINSYRPKKEGAGGGGGGGGGSTWEAQSYIQPEGYHVK